MSTATKNSSAATMPGVVLPGNSTVEFKEYPIPEPGHGQVLVHMKASSICGSDIRAIYREHLGKGPEGYQGVISGHEPCGQIVKVGPGGKRFQAGDRVVIYHISGCGVCDECQHGYMISCRSDHREAYGWQRDGGHAPYLLAEENNCIRLPDSLSYIDGASAPAASARPTRPCGGCRSAGRTGCLSLGWGRSDWPRPCSVAGSAWRQSSAPTCRKTAWRWPTIWGWSISPSRLTTAT